MPVFCFTSIQTNGIFGEIYWQYGERSGCYPFRTDLTTVEEAKKACRRSVVGDVFENSFAKQEESAKQLEERVAKATSASKEQDAQTEESRVVRRTPKIKK